MYGPVKKVPYLSSVYVPLPGEQDEEEVCGSGDKGTLLLIRDLSGYRQSWSLSARKVLSVVSSEWGGDYGLVPDKVWIDNVT